MKTILLLFLLLSNYCFAQPPQTTYKWVQYGDMKVNGTQSSWRRQLIDTTKIDTAFVNLDSALRNAFGEITGYKNGKNVVLFKETPKPKPVAKDTPQYTTGVVLLNDYGIKSNEGTFYLQQPDTILHKYLYKYYKSNTIIKKGKKTVKTTIVKKKVPVRPTKQKPEPKLYFIGNGEVIERYGDYVIIKYLNGTFTKKKPIQGHKR